MTQHKSNLSNLRNLSTHFRHFWYSGKPAGGHSGNSATSASSPKTPNDHPQGPPRPTPHTSLMGPFQSHNHNTWMDVSMGYKLWNPGPGRRDWERRGLRRWHTRAEKTWQQIGLTATIRPVRLPVTISKRFGHTDADDAHHLLCAGLHVEPPVRWTSTKPTPWRNGEWNMDNGRSWLLARRTKNVEYHLFRRCRVVQATVDSAVMDIWEFTAYSRLLGDLPHSPMPLLWWGTTDDHFRKCYIESVLGGLIRSKGKYTVSIRSSEVSNTHIYMYIYICILKKKPGVPKTNKKLMYHKSTVLQRA